MSCGETSTQTAKTKKKSHYLRFNGFSFFSNTLMSLATDLYFMFFFISNFFQYSFFSIISFFKLLTLAMFREINEVLCSFLNLIPLWQIMYFLYKYFNLLFFFFFVWYYGAFSWARCSTLTNCLKNKKKTNFKDWSETCKKWKFYINCKTNH